MPMSLQGSQMLLIGLEFKEWIDQRLNWEIRTNHLDSFNLIVGDNAQGKTRLFNIMRFVREVTRGTNKKFHPKLKIESHFWFQQDDERIEYILVYRGQDNAKPVFNETVIRGTRIVFSRNSKTLLDEKTNSEIKDFFIPETTSALFSLTDDKFQTVGLIRSFIERMLFLEGNSFQAGNVSIDLNATMVDGRGSNIGSVIINWMKDENRSKQLNELLSEFQKIFGFVLPGSVASKEISVPGSPIKAPVLTMKEAAVPDPIDQTAWSDGMMRTLCLLSLPLSRFINKNSPPLPPSLIFVDEIENGLDFKTLRRIVSFYEEYSNIIQIIFSSHSPLVCNMVEPKDWRISRRTTGKVELLPPDEKDLKLNSSRENLLLDNWQFYQRNIAAKKLDA